MQQQGLFDQFARAKEEAARRFNVGENEQRRLLQRVAEEVPRDRYVVPANMRFGVREKKGRPTLVHYYAAGEEEFVTIHPHALRQMCEKASLHITYAKYLANTDDTWKVELLAHNLSELFHKGTYIDRTKRPMRFLHRRVGSELRAFLSNSFNRHLVSAALLGPFVEGCAEAGAFPVEAVMTDLRVALKCYLPTPFQVMPGRYVCLGAQWSNSDFGVGRLTVAQTVWDPLRNTKVVLDETFSKVHLGPVIEGDTELELPDEINREVVQVQGNTIMASVKMMLQQEAIDRVLAGLKLACEKEIPWSTLKGQLGKILSERELQSVESLLRGQPDDTELPPPGMTPDGKPFLSRWWASELLSTLADKLGEGEKKLDLQLAAGKMLVVREGE